MNTLRSILDAEIEREGTISGARFMEIALYWPGLGYYEQAQAVGFAADFYTSVSVGPVFAELLAFQFSIWLEELDSARLQLIEAAAHHGQLAGDLLRWFERRRPELWRRIDYIIVEPSLILQSKQRAALACFPESIRWISNWKELETQQYGIVFSNELLDAFPAHVIRWEKSAQRWREVGVTRLGGSYIWAPLPRPVLAMKHFPQLPGELLNVLPDAFKTEINPAATAWWRAAANALGSGHLMTIDYGLETEEFFAPQRALGTLRAYQKHRPVDDLLADPGQQDLTAQVDFAKLRGAGEQEGLLTIEDTSQTRFLTNIVEQTTTGACFDEWTPKRVRQFQTLTHPDHLGRNFRVLAQKRG